MRLLTPVRYLDMPANFEGQPVDTLGAGDVFAAGYIAGLLTGLNLPQAVRLAEHAAAYKLGGAGREGLPGPEGHGTDHRHACGEFGLVFLVCVGAGRPRPYIRGF